MKIKIFILLIMIPLIDNFAQPQLLWFKEYDFCNSFDIPTNMAKDKYGNYIVVGTSVYRLTEISDYENVFLKYDMNGNLLWKRELNDPKSMNDAPDDMIIDDSSNVIICGTLGWYKYITKYDSDGNQKWIRPFPAKFDEYLELDDQNLPYVARTIIINEKAVPCITKYDYNGNIIWHNYFDTLSVNWIMPVDLIFDGIDNLYLLGNIYSNSWKPNELFVMKFNKNGNLIWYKKLGNGRVLPHIGYKIIKDLNNDFVILVNKNFTVELLKFNADGEILWEESFGYSDTNNRPIDLIIDNNNNIIISALIGSDTLNNIITPIQVIIKTDSKGNILFIKNLNDLWPGVNVKTLTSDLSDNIYCYCNHNYDLFIVKFNSDGDSIYTISSNIYGGINDPVEFVLNSEDDFTITATCGGLVKESNIVTFRYSHNILNLNERFYENKYSLFQNFPNPFNPSTTINYTIPEQGLVKINVYDVLGKELFVLLNEFQLAGKHSINFDGSILPSGIYFYSLSCNNFHQTKKMILIK